MAKKETKKNGKWNGPERKIMVKVAKDMNDVMGLEPKISMTLKNADLLEKIVDEATQALPNDEFTEDTWAFFRENQIEIDGELPGAEDEEQEPVSDEGAKTQPKVVPEQNKKKGHKAKGQKKQTKSKKIRKISEVSKIRARTIQMIEEEKWTLKQIREVIYQEFGHMAKATVQAQTYRSTLSSYAKYYKDRTAVKGEDGILRYVSN